MQAAAIWPEPKTFEMPALHTLVDELDGLDVEMQKHMLLTTDLLRNDINWRWFLTHANDSWDLNPVSFGMYIRTEQNRLWDYGTDFFNERPPITDGLQFIHRAMIWVCWDSVRIGLNRQEKNLLIDYRQNYLETQIEPLIYGGALNFKTLTNLRIKGLVRTKTESMLYMLDTPIETRDFIITKNRYGVNKVEKREVDMYDLAWADHFLNRWLPSLIPTTEYATAKDLHPAILRDLYADIHQRGPTLMDELYHQRVTATRVY